MPARAPTSIFTTKELSSETWPDFLKLFSQGNGWDHCACMHFHRPRRLPRSQWLPIRAERALRNRRQKRGLIACGQSHGILVYSKGEPIGWCQFGSHQELPRIDSSHSYGHLNPPIPEKLWRITCFVVLKPYRRLGVAALALEAALRSIKRRGGGVVEAYPIDWWLPRTFGNESTHGTVSMFKKAGFASVGKLSANRFGSHVLLRKLV